MSDVHELIVSTRERNRRELIAVLQDERKVTDVQGRRFWRRFCRSCRLFRCRRLLNHDDLGLLRLRRRRWFLVLRVLRRFFIDRRVTTKSGDEVCASQGAKPSESKCQLEISSGGRIDQRLDSEIPGIAAQIFAIKSERA